MIVCDGMNKKPNTQTDRHALKPEVTSYRISFSHRKLYVLVEQEY
jgi:hypothetical protein